MAPIPTPIGSPLAAGLPSSARYTATVSVRGLLVAEIQVLVPYRIHPSIHPSIPLELANDTPPYRAACPVSATMSSIRSHVA